MLSLQSVEDANVLILRRKNRKGCVSFFAHKNAAKNT